MIPYTPYVPLVTCRPTHCQNITLPKPHSNFTSPKDMLKFELGILTSNLPPSLFFILWPMALLYNQSVIELNTLIVLDSVLSLCDNIQSSHEAQSITLLRYSIYLLKTRTYLQSTHSVSKMLLAWSPPSALCCIPTAPVQMKAFITASFNLQNTIPACVQASSFLTHPMHIFHCHKNYLPKTQSQYYNYWLESTPLSPGVHKGYVLEQHSKSIILRFQPSFLAHLLFPTLLCISFSKRSPNTSPKIPCSRLCVSLQMLCNLW